MSNSTGWTRLVPALAGLALAGGACAQSSDTPAVTPYRPTVSNPADLPVPGWLELELGYNHGTTDGARVDSVPYLLKYAFTPDWGVLLGGDSWDYQRDAGGNRISGFGDTQIEVKHRIPVNDATAFGVELGLRVPTARSDLGSGRTDYIANGILSTDLGPVHLDLNAGPTWLGRPESGTGRVEWDWAAAASRGVLPDLNFAAELSGSARDDAPSSTRFLTAFAYSLSPRAVIDAGVSWGLGNIRGHTLFTGLTVLLGTLR